LSVVLCTLEDTSVYLELVVLPRTRCSIVVAFLASAVINVPRLLRYAVTARHCSELALCRGQSSSQHLVVAQVLPVNLMATALSTLVRALSSLSAADSLAHSISLLGSSFLYTRTCSELGLCRGQSSSQHLVVAQVLPVNLMATALSTLVRALSSVLSR